jgi:hypothetical protein
MNCNTRNIHTRNKSLVPSQNTSSPKYILLIAIAAFLVSGCGGGGSSSASGSTATTTTTTAVITTTTTTTTTTSSTTTTTVPAPVTGAPYVRFTDTLSGPITGGEGNAGAYLSIFGNNFGSSIGPGGTTKVYIGGIEVANYRYIGLAKAGAKTGMQQITVQVGNLGNPTLGTALPINVVVNGVSSNTDNTFTPGSGRILFVSLSGNDATAQYGDITHPWRYLQNISVSPFKGAYFSMAAGDHIVIRGGNWSDTNGGQPSSPSWMTFFDSPSTPGTYDRNGTATNWIHFTAYPGPINGNAIEDVHYTTPSGTTGGFQGPWSALTLAGQWTGEYVSFSNLHMDVAGGANRDAAPMNFQFTAGPWRVVNNELGPWVAGSSTVLNAAAVSGHGNGMKVLGNLIHDIDGIPSALQNHGIYADTTAQNWEVAYNWIYNATGGSLIQFNDNSGGAGSYVLPHGAGIWPGFVGIRIHDNWLETAAKYGINFNDQASTKLGAYEARAWNNVIIGTALPPIRINSTQPSQNLWFAYNTIYNCMTTSSGSGNSMVRNEGWANMAGVVNKFYDNIFMFGPNTVAGTQWLSDSIGSPFSPTTTTYDFKRNLYYANGQSPGAPATVGDTTALIGNPLFITAGTNFKTQTGSPARAAATQALPAGFSVVNDYFGASRGSGIADLGAFQSP